MTGLRRRLRRLLVHDVRTGETDAYPDLAGFVRQVMGQEIEQQREAVRAWLARSEPTQSDPQELLIGSSPSSSMSANAALMASYVWK